MKTVLIPIADGSEEIEAITLVNILRRSGLEVTLASIYNDRLEINGSRDIKITADKRLAECESTQFDGIFLPGGMPGAENLSNCPPLISMLKTQKSSERHFGAICASPALVLAKHGLLDGLKATCYPGFERNLPDSSCTTEPVVVDHKCVTGKSPGASKDFALTIVSEFLGPEKSNEIRNDLC